MKQNILAFLINAAFGQTKITFKSQTRVVKGRYAKEVKAKVYRKLPVNYYGKTVRFITL